MPHVWILMFVVFHSLGLNAFPRPIVGKLTSTEQTQNTTTTNTLPNAEQPSSGGATQGSSESQQSGVNIQFMDLVLSTEATLERTTTGTSRSNKETGRQLVSANFRPILNNHRKSGLGSTSLFDGMAKSMMEEVPQAQPNDKTDEEEDKNSKQEDPTSTTTLQNEPSSTADEKIQESTLETKAKVGSGNSASASDSGKASHGSATDSIVTAPQESLAAVSKLVQQHWVQFVTNMKMSVAQLWRTISRRMEQSLEEFSF